MLEPVNAAQALITRFAAGRSGVPGHRSPIAASGTPRGLNAYKFGKAVALSARC